MVRFPDYMLWVCHSLSIESCLLKSLKMIILRWLGLDVKPPVNPWPSPSPFVFGARFSLRNSYGNSSGSFKPGLVAAGAGHGQPQFVAGHGQSLLEVFIHVNNRLWYLYILALNYLVYRVLSLQANTKGGPNVTKVRGGEQWKTVKHLS